MHVHIQLKYEIEEIFILNKSLPLYIYMVYIKSNRSATL
jgi:hypothetical protein